MDSTQPQPIPNSGVMPLIQPERVSYQNQNQTQNAISQLAEQMKILTQQQQQNNNMNKIIELSAAQNNPQNLHINPYINQNKQNNQNQNQKLKNIKNKSQKKKKKKYH